MSESRIRNTDVVVVGGGFAGIRCATLLAKAGIDVCVLEENAHMGGQLLRTLPWSQGKNPKGKMDPVKKMGHEFLEQLRMRKVEIETNTSVFGIYPNRELAVEVEENRVDRIRFKYLVLANGARERFFPFPGWTLPGVMSAGMVQVMIKSSGIRPADRILFGGSGLFLLSAAHEFIGAGGKVLAVTEDTGIVEKINMIPHVLKLPVKMFEGARYISTMLLKGVAYRFRTRILAAEGSGSLENVVTVRTDRQGRIRPGTERRIPVEAMGVGYGFIPNTDLCQLAGCDLDYKREMGGWVVRTNENLETGVPGVFAAGEPTGVAGALKSIVEGEMVAWRVLQQMEKTDDRQAESRLSKLRKKREVHLRFGACFNGLFRVPDAAYRDIPDETIICRCEDVKLGDIRTAVTQGYRTLADLKTAFRVTMGGCQGRNCAAMIQEILGVMTGNRIEDMAPVSSRPPSKPVRISSFSD